MITQTGSSGALRGGPSAAVVPVTSVLQGGGARVRGPGLGPAAPKSDLMRSTFKEGANTYVKVYNCQTPAVDRRSRSREGPRHNRR